MSVKNSLSLPPPCRVEIYEDSFMNGPAASFETAAPRPVRIGDLIDRDTWPEAGSAPRVSAPGQTLRVKAVNLTRWQLAGTPGGRSLSICVEVVARV